MTVYDAIIIGAGAAGLFCGWQAAARGRRVLVLDHMAKPGEKIRISGGGRCNFTNRDVTAKNFLSENPHFAKSALARFTPWDFISLVSEAGIAWHEKTLGQLFCDGKSTQIIELLVNGLKGAGGELRLSSPVREISHTDSRFRLCLDDGTLKARRLVIATGGLSIPKLGASPFGYDLARRFSHRMVEPRPALVPFTFAEPEKSRFAGLSGVATPCVAQAGHAAFDEAMLFTHRGLSGPAILQISSYWRPGERVRLDLLPGRDAAAELRAERADAPRRSLAATLGRALPNRLVEALGAWLDLPLEKRMADVSNAEIARIAGALSHFAICPDGTEGYRTAEVTAGGVDTGELSSKTMESRHVPGLYFIGEVVDVTGWLGGYNFQWAWSSAHACAEAL
jgi:predicted Rossmann fold flavoprotein